MRPDPRHPQACQPLARQPLARHPQARRAVRGSIAFWWPWPAPHRLNFWRLAYGLLAWSLALGAAPAAAVHYRVAGLGGMMLQPSSQYYHAVFGGAALVTSDKYGFQLRGQYTARPIFRASGYTDDEEGGAIFVGTELKRWRILSLSAFLGYGGMQGRIREDLSGEQRRYAVNGVTALASAELSLGPLWLALSHQSLVGIDDAEQTKAYVAWPFSFFFLELGAQI